MNTKAFTFILIASLGLAPLHGLQAQDYVTPPVTISKERIRMDGKLYYSHVVLEKQTLYSISRAYGVTIEQIYEANQAIREVGLKKNSIILIPAYDMSRTAKEIRQEQKETEKQQRAEERSGKEEEKKNFITHTVKWYEDLNVISEKYGVSVESIMEANDLKGRKLKNRQKLRIPLADDAIVTVQPEAEKNHGNDVPATTGSEEGQILTVTQLPTVQHTGKSKINAVVMLPFNASGPKPSENCMDFYSGVLLAAKDLGEEGINIDISTYDTGYGSLPITEERLRETDVVIGPFSPKELEALLAKAPASTRIVSPLDHRAEALAATHANLIHAPSSLESQYTDIAAWIKEEMSPQDSVIVIHEKSIKGADEAGFIKSRLEAEGIRYTTFSYSILEGRDVMDALVAKISKASTNRVVVASESEAFVNDAIRNVNLLIHNRYPIVIYCNSKIRSYETADIDNLHNANARVSMSYYIDYDNPKVQSFLMRYRALYNTEPTAFAYQGYDIMSYFVGMCARYGDNWPSMLPIERLKMLQSTFGFGKVGDGGFSNTAVRRVIYNPDYTITELND